MPTGQLELGRHRLLGPDEAGRGLVDPQGVVARVHRREAATDLVGVQHLVVEAVLAGRGQTPAEHLTVRVADVDPTAQSEDVATGFGLQRPPPGEGALQQRHVRRTLEIGLSDDPAAAVHRAAVVGRPEGFQTQHPYAPGRQRVRRRRTHRAEADDDGVVTGSAVDLQLGQCFAGRWNEFGTVSGMDA